MTTLGQDCSHYDAPDTRPAVADGMQFLTHKAGGDQDDPEIGAWWNLMQPYRDQVLLGAYWVLYPGNPQGRADAFLNRLDATCPGWRDGPFILQADCEIWGGNTSTKPGRADIEAFCDRLAGAMPKLVPIVYAPKWAYGNELAGLPYPIWASSYVTGTGTAAALYPGDGSSRWAAYSGQTPAILQYTSSATIGGQTTCDANAYRGTLAQLTALLAPGWSDDVNLTDKIGDPAYAGRTVQTHLLDEQHLRDYLIGDPAGGKLAGVAAGSPLAKMVGVAGQVDALTKQVTALGASLTAAITALAAKDFVDEQALAQQLAPGVAAAVTAGLPNWQNPIPADELEQVILAVLQGAFAARPATLTAADEDEVTRRAREARQPGIAG